ncbi:MAG: 3'-5' exonuclease, partial [Chloroflexota bacterium]
CKLGIFTGDIDNERGILIQPTESKLSDFCTELTGITQTMLDEEGVSFDDACAELVGDYDAKSRLWVSWGNYDRRMFQQQCERRGVEYPFADQHCNLKNLFANIYGNRLGMKAALDKIKLPLKGRHHRGVDDAVNIASILSFMLDKHGYDLLDSFWE